MTAALASRRMGDAANAVRAARPGTRTVSDWWFGPGGGSLPALAPAAVADDARLRRAYPFDPADLDLPFRELGWARLTIGPEALRVTFDLGRAAPRALANIADRLTGIRGPCPTLLVFFVGGAWARERLATPDAAADRIETLAGCAGDLARRPPGTRFAALARADAGPLPAAAWSCWNERPGSSADLRLERAAPLLPRAALFRPAGAGGYRLDHVGPRSALAHVFGQEWAARAGGADALPDQAYDASVSAPYAAVVAGGRPTFERVVAPIRTVHAPEPLWFAYDRLLLPVIDRRGGRAIRSVLAVTGPAAPDSGGGRRDPSPLR